MVQTLRASHHEPVLQLVSSRYERASLIFIPTPPFSGWGRAFGDQTVAESLTASSTTPNSSR